MRFDPLFLSVVIITLFFNSCSPRISTSISKSYNPLPENTEIQVFDLNEKLPETAILLGTISIDDTGFTTNCDYKTILEVGKAEARKAGGNILKIEEHKFPGMQSSCHQIKASIYKTDDLSMVKFLSKKDSINESSSTQTDSISFSAKGLGYGYMYNNRVLDLGSLETILSSNTAAYEMLRKAKSSSVIISILSYTGGFLIGYPLGTMLRGDNPNWTMALIGCGLIAIDLPIVASAEKKLLNAVKIYNSGIYREPISQKMNLKFGLNQNGLALVLKF